MAAIDTFHKEPWKHNCAQAVAHQWRRLYAFDDAALHFAPYGSGRAPGGMCGALYAATRACPDHADEIVADFRNACGYINCREIKALSHTPCPKCVEVADKLVEIYINK